MRGGAFEAAMPPRTAARRWLMASLLLWRTCSGGPGGPVPSPRCWTSARAALAKLSRVVDRRLVRDLAAETLCNTCARAFDDQLLVVNQGKSTV